MGGPERDEAGDAAPIVEEARTALRDSMERAHELVAEAKELMRQLREDHDPVAGPLERDRPE